MRVVLRLLVGVAALSGVLFGTGTVHAASATSGSFGNVTCKGGAIAPGTYASIRVKGICAIPNGKVLVHGFVTIENNAALIAVSQTATVIIQGNVTVEPGATLLLGCSPAFGCSTTTNDRINGELWAEHPLAVILHGDTIHGNISFRGGGNGVSCAPNPLFNNGPVFSDIEDSTIFGGVTVTGYQSCWFGFIRNHVHGRVMLIHNTFADPDAMEVTTNFIWGSLLCYRNTPAAQFGDSGGKPNIVKGKKLGECAKL